MDRRLTDDFLCIININHHSIILEIFYTDLEPYVHLGCVWQYVKCFSSVKYFQLFVCVLENILRKGKYFQLFVCVLENLSKKYFSFSYYM